MAAEAWTSLVRQKYHVRRRKLFGLQGSWEVAAAAAALAVASAVAAAEAVAAVEGE